MYNMYICNAGVCVHVPDVCVCACVLYVHVYVCHVYCVCIYMCVYGVFTYIYVDSIIELLFSSAQQSSDKSWNVS